MRDPRILVCDERVADVWEDGAHVDDRVLGGFQIAFDIGDGAVRGDGWTGERENF